MKYINEQTKEDARRLADDMRDGAERLRKGAEDTFNKVKEDAKSQFSQHYNYMSIIHQLRTGQIISLVMQMTILYLDYNILGFLGFFIPIGVILANVALVGQRWYHRIDGRKDINIIQNSSVKPVDKIQNAVGLFGPFVLALLAHYITPEIPSSVSAMIYRLLAYLSILIGAGTAGIEIYEGMKQKAS